MIAEEKLVEQMLAPPRERIVAWLSDYLCDLLALEPGELDTERTFSRYGLDSSAAVGMTGDLGAWLGVDIDPAVVYDYPSIARLADHLAEDPQIQAKLRSVP